MTTPSQSGSSNPPTKPGTPITKPKPKPRPGMPRPTRYVDSQDLGLRGPQVSRRPRPPSWPPTRRARAGFPPVPGAVPNVPAVRVRDDGRVDITGAVGAATFSLPEPMGPSRFGDGPSSPGNPPPAPPPPFPPNPFPRPFAG